MSGLPRRLVGYHKLVNSLINPYSDERRDLSKQSTHHYIKCENLAWFKRLMPLNGFTHHTNDDDDTRTDYYRKGDTLVSITGIMDQINGKHLVEIDTKSSTSRIEFDNDH